VTEAEWLTCTDPTPMRVLVAPKAGRRHCRSSGPHVRGCWLVDFLLNKD
jgi:hypothetical protein